MLQITITELKNQTGRYLALADRETIYVTKHGKRIAKISGTRIGKEEAVTALLGLLPNDIDLDEARTERLR